MIVFDNKLHGQRIGEASGSIFNPLSDPCISVVKGGELVGGVTYQGYTGTSIHMHVAGFTPRWMNRVFLWLVFDYPFNQMGCKTVFAQVPASNARALEIDRKLGFKEVARIDDVFPDGACCVLALVREDCRWLDRKPSSL